ncbi:hypothetical protein [Sphingobium olei]|uniref:Uncharacterized protein n=1 Tax=Sphingobium olei TaxID=420955 RepID=A0ABW3NXQ5_9SPHN
MKIPLKPILKWVGTTLVTAALQDALGRLTRAGTRARTDPDPAPIASADPVSKTPEAS